MLAVAPYDEVGAVLYCIAVHSGLGWKLILLSSPIQPLVLPDSTAWIGQIKRLPHDGKIYQCEAGDGEILTFLYEKYYSRRIMYLYNKVI